MLFGSRIDSAPADLPIEGLEPQTLTGGIEPQAVQLPVEGPIASLPLADLPLAGTSPLHDPGLAAALTGGATFSEPIQWLMVTAAGLFCAAVGQELIASRTTSPKATTEVSAAAITSADLAPANIAVEKSNSSASHENESVAIVPKLGEVAPVAAPGTNKAQAVRIEPAKAERAVSTKAERKVLTSAPSVVDEGDVGSATVAKRSEVEPIGTSSAAKPGSGAATSKCVPVARTRLFGGKRR